MPFVLHLKILDLFLIQTRQNDGIFQNDGRHLHCVLISSMATVVEVSGINRDGSPNSRGTPELLISYQLIPKNITIIFVHMNFSYLETFYFYMKKSWQQDHSNPIHSYLG